MKNQFIPAFVMVVIVAFSSMAFAGGAGCDSMKGGHKDMSVEALKELKENHVWLNSPHEQTESSPASSIEKPEVIEVKKSTPDMVEIQSHFKEKDYVPKK